MLSRPQIIVTYARRYSLVVCSFAVLVFLTAAGSALWAQNNAVPADPTGNTDLQIEVVDVTTGSGSKTEAPAKPPLQIEVMDVNSGAGSKAANTGNQAPVAPNRKGLNKASPTAAAEKGAETDPRRQALMAALDRWHFETLTAYNYNIQALADPFMPILEVRGQPVERIDPTDWEKRTPIEKLELSQLKLVAITYLSERQGGAWASFEDGANNSYILSQGSKIGRNYGRITKIAPNEVWVEERGHSGQEAPKTTVVRMIAVDTQGLTRDSGSENAGQLQTLSVPGGQ